MTMPRFGKIAALAAPASMRRLRLGGAALTLAILTIASSGAPVLGWSSSSFSSDDEALLFTLTNQDRASAGLDALVNDSYLHQKAEWRAQDMGDRDYFSHTIPPDNQMVFYYMQQDNYCFKVAGENIGLSTYGDDVATNRIETAFMNSATHRANILGDWQHMGVGAYEAADGRKLYTVLFSIPCGVAAPKPPPPATPTPVPTPTPTPPPTGGTAPSGSLAPIVTPPPTTGQVTTGGTAGTTPGTAGSGGGSGGSPTAVPTPTASPVATGTPSPSAASPTASTTAAPAASASDTAGTSGQTDAAAAPTSGSETSLRVHEKAASAGPIDSFLHAIFGGLFGW